MKHDSLEKNTSIGKRLVSGRNKRISHNLAVKYWQTMLLSKLGQVKFKNIDSFVVFVGYERSGHSLVGSLLDAHPDIIIAHELDILFYLERGFSNLQAYHMLLENSRITAKQGRSATGYSYEVQGQWQGKYRNLKIIGDKRGGMTSLRISYDPTVLDKLLETIPVPIKFIHVLRHPLDNISTIAKRRETNITEEIIEFYFDQCNGVQVVKDRVSSENIHEFRSEDLISNKYQIIKNLTEFLGVETSKDYLNACMDIIYDRPSITRNSQEWAPQLLDIVHKKIQKYEFLKPYFENR